MQRPSPGVRPSRLLSWNTSTVSSSMESHPSMERRLRMASSSWHASKATSLVRRTSGKRMNTMRSRNRRGRKSRRRRSSSRWWRQRRRRWRLRRGRGCGGEGGGKHYNSPIQYYPVLLLEIVLLVFESTMLCQTVPRVFTHSFLLHPLMYVTPSVTCVTPTL